MTGPTPSSTPGANDEGQQRRPRCKPLNSEKPASRPSSAAAAGSPLKPLRGSLIARSGTGPGCLHWLGRPVADLDPPLVAGPFGPPAGSTEAGRFATFVLVVCACTHPARTSARPNATTRLR